MPYAQKKPNNSHRVLGMEGQCAPCLSSTLPTFMFTSVDTLHDVASCKQSQHYSKWQTHYSAPAQLVRQLLHKQSLPKFKQLPYSRDFTSWNSFYSFQLWMGKKQRKKSQRRRRKHVVTTEHNAKQQLFKITKILSVLDYLRTMAKMMEQVYKHSRTWLWRSLLSQLCTES